MIRPHSLDTDMLQRIRQLVGNLYCGRDDLYQIAEQLTDTELAAICNKLADDLAANNSHWEQIILMHGEQLDIKEALTTVLGAEIMKLLREGQSDKERVNLAQDEESKLAQESESPIRPQVRIIGSHVIEEVQQRVGLLLASLFTGRLLG